MRRQIKPRPASTKGEIAMAGDLADNSRGTYLRGWSVFERWCAGRRLSTVPSKTDAGRRKFAAQITEFLHDEYQRGVSLSTLGMLRAAIAWKLRGEIRASNWKDRIVSGALTPVDNPANSEAVKLYVHGAKKKAGEQPRQAERLYVHEVEKAIASSFEQRPAPGKNVLESVDRAKERGLEDRAIFAFLFYSLMRRSEVSNLRWRAVRIFDDRAEVIVEKAKNNPTGDRIDRRIVPEPARTWIDDLRKHRGDVDPDDFVFSSGRSDRKGLSESRLNDRFKASLEWVGIRGHSAHSGRVGMATLMAEQGFTDLQIAEAGGWKSLNTVKRYTEGRKKDARPVVDLMKKIGG